MMKTAIPAILLVLVSRGKKTSDTSIVGIAAIPKTIPKTIPAIIRNEKNEKNGIAIPKRSRAVTSLIRIANYYD